MKNHSTFTKACLVALLIVGSAMPVFSEPFPQPHRSYDHAIIDWEDEFVQDSYSASMSTEKVSEDNMKKPTSSVSSNVPVIDWEDEFPYEIPKGAISGESQVMMKKENAASWDFEDWQSI